MAILAKIKEYRSDLRTTENPTVNSGMLEDIAVRNILKGLGGISFRFNTFRMLRLVEKNTNASPETKKLIYEATSYLRQLGDQDALIPEMSKYSVSMLHITEMCHPGDLEQMEKICRSALRKN